MLVRAGQLAIDLQVGRLDHAHVGAADQRQGAVAGAGVHHEGERGPALGRGHLLQRDRAPVGELHAPRLLELPDLRALQPERGELLLVEADAVPLLDPVAVGVDRVLEPVGLDLERRVLEHDAARPADRLGHDLAGAVVDRRAQQAVEVLLPAGREVDLDRLRHAVEREPLHDPGQAQRVVAVEVGDEHLLDLGDRDVGQDELALCPLARVEQEPDPVPAQQVTIVVTEAGGDLARGPEGDEFPEAHGERLTEIPRVPGEG